VSFRQPPPDCAVSRAVLRQGRRRPPRHARRRPPLSATDHSCLSAPTPPSTPSDAPVSTPRCHVLVPLHRHPRMSPPNRRAARHRCPRLAVPPDAAIYAHELSRAAFHALVRPRRAFLGRLPCTGEVAAVAQACRAVVRAHAGGAGPARGMRVLR
jgi:hypothetical protein